MILCNFPLPIYKNQKYHKKKSFLKKSCKNKTFFSFPIDKRGKKMYNIKLHYNRLICLKMGRDCFRTAVDILILYEKINFASKSGRIPNGCKKAKNT